MEKLLSPREAAEILGVSLPTLYTWTYRRQIPAQKVGRLLRFSPAALQRWLKGQEQRTLAEQGISE